MEREVRGMSEQIARTNELSSDSILSIRGLHSAYQSKAILRGVDLEIPAGSIFGYLGKNGAGKYLPFTTLIYLASPHTVAELTTFSERDVINLSLLGISLFIGYRCFTPEKRSSLRNHIH